MRTPKTIPPLALPVLFFAAVIGCGTALLHASFCHANQAISWIDALFTATSATCVTGLAVVDTGSFFNRTGQLVILGLIQAGGLGIMSFTSLAFYLWRRRVSITDRIAVGQILLHDPSFHLGRFLKRIMLFALTMELAGALLLLVLDPQGFPPVSALFHAVSAFCNAGFALQADSLMGWRGDWGINLVLMALIIMGGLGFSVLMECQYKLAGRLTGAPSGSRRLSWYARLVLSTSGFLIAFGWLIFYLAEFGLREQTPPFNEKLLSALFQSVTCRTAGFNTLDIGQLTNFSLLFMVVLMFIGGAPGSCAGGIKVTTFRVLWGFIAAQLKGRQQTVIGRFAVDRDSLHSALILFIFANAIILSATLLLDFTEGGRLPHPETRGMFLEILFETVSAFGTVGLSTGLTPTLSGPGKLIITMLMFIGRLGPLVFLGAVQSLQTQPLYLRPEEKIQIG